MGETDVVVIAVIVIANVLMLLWGLFIVFACRVPESLAMARPDGDEEQDMRWGNECPPSRVSAF